MPNCIIGLLTRIRDARRPFQRAKTPYDLTKFFPATIIDCPFYACFVLRTQNGLVAIAETQPAEPELFVILKNDSGLKPNNFLA